MSADDRDRKRVVRDDNLFFKRHPDRQYRIRRASSVEIRAKEAHGGLPPLPQGLSWFLAIWSPAPRRRLCLFIPNKPDASTNLDEGAAHAVFEYAVASCPDLSRRASAVEGNHAARH